MNKNISSKKVLQILSQVAQNLQEKKLLKSQEKIVVTISGGQDSICLLIIFFLLRTQLLVTFDLLFCHHFWQKSSFFTMLHVAKCNFCCSSKIMFFLPLQQLISEKTARDWRHKVIQRTILFYGYTTATQAHTRSDRIESILFNLIRGTGLAGASTLQFHHVQSLFSYNKFYPVTLLLSPITSFNTFYFAKSRFLHTDHFYFPDALQDSWLCERDTPEGGEPSTGFQSSDSSYSQREYDPPKGDKASDTLPPSDTSVAGKVSEGGKNQREYLKAKVCQSNTFAETEPLYETALLNSQQSLHPSESKYLFSGGLDIRHPKRFQLYGTRKVEINGVFFQSLVKPSFYKVTKKYAFTESKTTKFLLQLLHSLTSSLHLQSELLFNTQKGKSKEFSYEEVNVSSCLTALNNGKPFQNNIDFTREPYGSSRGYPKEDVWPDNFGDRLCKTKHDKRSDHFAVVKPVSFLTSAGGMVVKFNNPYKLNGRYIYDCLSVYVSPLLQTPLYRFVTIGGFDLFIIIHNKRILELVAQFAVLPSDTLPATLVSEGGKKQKVRRKGSAAKSKAANYFYTTLKVIGERNPSITDKCLVKSQNNVKIKTYKTYYNQLKELATLRDL